MTPLHLAKLSVLGDAYMCVTMWAKLSDSYIWCKLHSVTNIGSLLRMSFILWKYVGSALCIAVLATLFSSKHRFCAVHGSEILELTVVLRKKMQNLWCSCIYVELKTDECLAELLFTQQIPRNPLQLHCLLLRTHVYAELEKKTTSIQNTETTSSFFLCECKKYYE